MVRSLRIEFDEGLWWRAVGRVGVASKHFDNWK
jgi:hypothetical protein